MTDDSDNLKIFAARSNPALAGRICDYLQIPLGRGKTELFPDGELMIRIEEDVRGRDCFVVQSTCDPVNAHLMELFIWIDCLRRASAARITAVMPYEPTRPSTIPARLPTLEIVTDSARNWARM